MKEEKVERRIIQSEYQDLKINCTLLENPDSRGLCVLFPGKGYTVDKPLLYYATRLAMQKGYNLLILSYGEFSLNERTRHAMGNLVSGVVDEVLTGEDRSGDLVFLGKSVGALFASDAAQRQNQPVRCVYLTPIDQMVDTMALQIGIINFMAFTGSEDHLLDHEKALETLGEAASRLKVYPGADHSLNAGTISESVRILSDVLEEIGRFIE
ncbi:hypothetical protein [Proteiniclasticum sp. QWL-01]|uniref:hypothetical protein n=1 Tax=Proteiniclasticum sp. QWL-01 TaxID=3036945 RepID=UPI00220A1C91|nr:hypothetical protein [Proteiniclasticum sp. QWL-01]UUM13121.1 hypothetical protein NQU17_06075 [Clostridiaceae bacterium HFYG-1003]WFF71548.1 hypothetical protein P6M73_09500 [Proteiniclasticum sp. QWL-01]